MNGWFRYFAVVVALASAGCACESALGIESTPAGAKIYLRGDGEVSFAPIPHFAGNVRGVMTTPNNLNHLRIGKLRNVKEAIFFKVIWDDDKESEPLEVKTCENALLKFYRDKPPEKIPVTVAVTSSPSRELVAFGVSTPCSG